MYHHFLNTLLSTMNLKNDAALSHRLQVAPPVISKLRHGKLTVGPSLLISAHEESGLSIKELKELIHGKQTATENPHEKTNPPLATVPALLST